MKGFGGEIRRKEPLGRPRCRWEDSIKIDFEQDGRVWTVLIWLRRVTSGGLL